jgi:trimeric autotransporter adhesin
MKTSQKKLSGWRALLFPAILAILTGGQDLFSQGVGISEAPITPDASSILELRSTVRGLLTPRMTTLERLAIASPAQGLLVYDTTTRSYWYFDSGWKAFASGAWGLSNQLLGMNAAGDANEYKTLSGTLNQVNVTHNPGLITLSTPQDIAPSSSPVFNSLTLTNPLTIPNGGTNSATPLDGSSIMISNGISIVQGEKGTLNTVLHGNPAGAPFYSQVLNADIAADAVTTDKIMDETIISGDIRDGTIANIDLDKLNIPLSGFGAAVLNVDLGSQRIINLQNPVDNQDAATKIYVDNAVDSDNNLLEGNIWVGDNTNNQAMVDASQSGFMLVGDGTTVNSVDITGDVDVDATGLTTIQPNAVTTLEILDETILATDIATGAVTTEEILDETILAEDIATGAVTTEEILNETILAEDIADDAVTTSEILDHTIADIDLDKINIPLSGFGAAVLNVDLGSQRITNLQNPVDNQDAATKIYVDNAVDSDNNLLEGNIWVGDNTNNQAMVDASQSGFMLVGDGTTVNSVDITGDVDVDATGLTTIQPNAVTTLEILDETILATDIAPGAVTTEEILDETILEEDIATGAVTTEKILDDTILEEDIAPGAVTTEEIRNETILAEDIADDAVTTSEILDHTIADIDLDKLNIPLSGFGAAVLNVDLGSQRIINLQNPVDNQDAATKIYVDNSFGVADNLDEGHIWVGDNTNNQAMVDASQSGFMLVGDGTTVNSVDITGDVEVDAAGLTTIQPDAVTTLEILNGTILNADIADGTINLREKVTNVLPVENGGTNSGTPLVGGRVMVSRDGRIVEAGVMNPGQVVVGTASDPAIVTVTGDISIDQSGATVIGNGAVNSAKISDGTVMNSDIAGSAAIDATKIAAGTVDNDELGYLDGVSSGIQGQFTGVQTGIADEITRATAAEVLLTTNLNNEVTRATNAETTLAGDITAEEARAMAAETVLTNSISAEVTRATNAEATLTTNLAAEVTRATNAETSLGNDIAAEETRALAAETVLTNSISAEVTRATNAEATLTTNLAAEVTRATNAETVLANDISAEEARAIGNDIAAETALVPDKQHFSGSHQGNKCRGNPDYQPCC